MLNKYYMGMSMEKVLNKIFFLVLLFLFSINNIVFSQEFDSIVKDKSNYSFIVAGHAYGSHQGTNLGLYPKFHEKLKGKKKDYDFIVLVGDFVRDGNIQNWKQVISELDSIQKPYFL